MALIHIDFETKSKIDIKKAGAGRYCCDPSTDILCVAYARDDGPILIEPNNKYPKIFDRWIAEGHTFVAHNAFFEASIWKYVWKREPPPFMCTRAKAYVHGLPGSLDRLAKALKIEHQKNIEGAVLIKLFSIPNKEGKFNRPEDHPEEFKKFMEYCRQDVAVEREANDKLRDVTEYEDGIFQLTYKINDRGVLIDKELAKQATKIAEELKEYCNEELKELTDGKIHAITQAVRIKNYINENYDLELDSINRENIETLLGQDIDPDLRKILTLRLEFSRSSVAKFTRAVDSQCEDGRIRDHMVYHGASTGRWTSQAVQFHNLPRGIKINQETCVDIIKTGDAGLMDLCYENPMSALSTCIRGLLVAPEGKKLMVADYSAIEARVLVWMADQKSAIRQFKDGVDIYVEMAKKIYCNPNLTKDNFDERQLGKQAVLGCGYQMGAERFKGTCQSYGMGVDDELASLAVQTYRNTYNRVVSFWSDIEQAAKHTLRTKKPCRCGRVTFYILGRFLFCKLPSGRSLAYYCPGMEEKQTSWGEKKQTIFYYTQDSQTRNFKKTHTYGGKLTENVIQAISRDIMADAMLTLEENTYEVILSVHDEIICEVPKNNHHSLDTMIDIMCDLPLWAKGCPINAEGWEGDRYKK